MQRNLFYKDINFLLFRVWHLLPIYAFCGIVVLISTEKLNINSVEFSLDPTYNGFGCENMGGL